MKINTARLVHSQLVRYLRVSLVIILGLVALIGSGGGGGGGGGVAPTISNLQYSPQGAFLNDGDGTITLSGSIDFNDPDGDVSRYTLVVVDSGDHVISTLSDLIPGINGIPSGTLVLAVLVGTTVVDDYHFSVYLTDAQGHVSSTLDGVFPVIGPTPTASLLPETGVDRCYNQSSRIDCPLAETDAFYGQDYQYAAKPMSFTNNGDGTISDNVTSLMWRMDADASPYNWYQASGTYEATQNPASTNVCGDSTFGGYGDWRLPERRELQSLVNYGDANPAIDASYFPNTDASYDYWSNTGYAADAAKAWYGQYASGSILQGNKTTGMHVRCVRGAVWGTNDFTDNADGTVTDANSGLMWQQTGQGSGHDWEQMLGVCEGLDFAGYTDWRLPDIKELATIVGAEASLDIQPGIYCSSSTIADDNASVWMIQFSTSSNYGEVFRHGAGDSKAICSSFYSRCVR